MLVINSVVQLQCSHVLNRFDVVEYTRNQVLEVKQKYGIGDEAARFNITLKDYPVHQLYKVSNSFVSQAGMIWATKNIGNIHLVLLKEDRKTLCQIIPKWANGNRLFENH